MLISVLGVFVLFSFIFENQLQLPLIPTRNEVLVIPIKGEITSQPCKTSLFYGKIECAYVKDIKETLKKAEESPSVKAIILEINSGGGEVIASRELMEAIRDFKKPIIAKIDEIAASGAYYVASAADEIVADKHSIIGGIGVIMVIHHYYGLYEKLGINVTVIKSGKEKDIGSPYRPMTEEERKELKEMIDSIYEDLLLDISRNRNMDLDYLRDIADGSIYLGKDAKDLGLVDEIGNMETAINASMRLANLSKKPEIVRAIKKESIFDFL